MNKKYPMLDVYKRQVKTGDYADPLLWVIILLLAVTEMCIRDRDVTGYVKVYDTDARTFTVNPVEGYNVTVTVGSVNLKPVNGVYTVPTLTADTTINVVYEATAGVYVNVTNSDNGKITIDGQEVSSKKVGLNSCLLYTSIRMIMKM